MTHFEKLLFCSGGNLYTYQENPNISRKERLSANRGFNFLDGFNTRTPIRHGTGTQSQYLKKNFLDRHINRSQYQ